MSMRGSVQDKLRWTFKLYDKDGSGEIDPEEMEDVFKVFSCIHCLLSFHMKYFIEAV